MTPVWDSSSSQRTTTDISDPHSGIGQNLSRLSVGSTQTMILPIPAAAAGICTGGWSHSPLVPGAGDGKYTLFIEFRDAAVAETRNLDENTILDLDASGNVCSITVEHASTHVD